MNKTTAIFYTSNREDERFEKIIRIGIKLACDDTPIISVSHKPIDFGINISVGEREACNHNLFRQIQIGAKLAATPFITLAEADCLYTFEYFYKLPQVVDECYKHTNLYMLNKWGKGECSGFYKKEIGTFAMVVGREHLIREIDKVLKSRPFWDKRREERPLELFRRRRWKFINNINPIVSIKTGNGMNKHTKIIEPPVDNISYWGSANKLRKELFA